MENHLLSASLKGHSGVIQSLMVYKQDSKKHIASGCDKGVIKLWDLEENQLITTLGQGTHSVCKLWSPSDILRTPLLSRSVDSTKDTVWTHTLCLYHQNLCSWWTTLYDQWQHQQYGQYLKPRRLQSTPHHSNRTHVRGHITGGTTTQQDDTARQWQL